MGNGLCFFGRHAQMGLGTMLEEFCEAMEPERVINIDCQDGRTPSVVPVKNMVTITRTEWDREANKVNDLLEGMKVVVGVETWFRNDFPQMCRNKGIKTVMFPMWEWSHDSIRAGDLLVCLSPTDYGIYQAPKSDTKLPHTIFSDWPACPAVHDPNRVINWPPKTFVHCAGNAHHNRDGTKEALGAAQFLEGTGAKLVVYHNFPITVPTESSPFVELRGSVPNRINLLAGADCMVCPRGLPGHSLPINEATGEGISVITLDLPDWARWPYRVSGYKMGSTLQSRVGRTPLWEADCRQLGTLMFDMARGALDHKHGPKLPTWAEFKETWQTWMSNINS